MTETTPQFLYLTTVGWKTANFHEIEIWFVQYGDRFYVVSEKHDQAHWVINLQHNPHAHVFVNEEDFPVVGRLVDADTEADLAAEVVALMDAKYGWSEGLIVELTPQ